MFPHLLLMRWTNPITYLSLETSPFQFGRARIQRRLEDVTGFSPSSSLTKLLLYLLSNLDKLVPSVLNAISELYVYRLSLMYQTSNYFHLNDLAGPQQQ